MAKVSKGINQNLLDFIIENYGNLNNMNDFISNYSMTDFKNGLLTTEYTINPTLNEDLDYITINKIQVRTGEPEILSDFNDDFNEDFLI